MANHLLRPLLLLVPSLLITTTTSAINPKQQPSPFISSSCKLTLYPDLCIQSLSPFSTSIRQNDHRHLALTALSFSLSRARSASSYISAVLRPGRPSPAALNQAVNDCIRNMADGVARLTQSVSELGQMGSGGPEDRFQWHMSNLQTWVSTALTCENSCLDGFNSLDGPVKNAVRNRVVYVAKVTSNALALIHGFASKHDRPGRLP